MSAERIAEIKGIIAEMQGKIEEGLPGDRKEVVEIKIFEYREELAELERNATEPQELPEEVTEEVKPEPILATVGGEPLEMYTDYPTLIRDEVEKLLNSERRISKEAIDDYKKLFKQEQDANRILQERNASLEKDYEDLLESEDNLRSDYNELKVVAADFESKFKALELLNEGIEQQLRDALIEVNRNRELKAQTEAERSEQAEAERQKLMNSRIKIYNVKEKPEEYPCVTKVCKIAETGEDHEYHYFHKGRYLEITEEEALNMQAMNKPVPTPPIDEVVNQEQFQSEAESAQDLDATEDCTEQREAIEVEPESFEERTERRLAAIERRLDKNEPEFIHDLAS